MVKMMGSFTMPLLEPRRQLTTNRGSKINPQRFHLGRTNRNLLRYTTVSLEKKEKSMAKSQDLKPRHQLLGLSVSQFHLWHHWSWWISCRRPGAYHLRICAFLGLGFPNINIQKPGAPCRKLPKLHFQRTPVRLPWPSNPSFLYHLSGRLVQLRNPCPTIISGAISLVTFGKRIKFHPPGPVYSGAPVVTPMVGGSLPRHLVVGNLGQRWIQSMSFCLGWNGFRSRLKQGNWWKLETLPGTLKLTASRYATLKIWLFIPKREIHPPNIDVQRRDVGFGRGLSFLDAFSLFDLPQTWVIWWPLHNYMWPWGPFPTTRHPKLTTTIRS